MDPRSQHENARIHQNVALASGLAFGHVVAAFRSSHGGKNVKGRKCHILVDTEGFVLKAKVHSAKVMDYEGIKTLLHGAQERFPRLRHLWWDAGYRGEDRGANWV